MGRAEGGMEERKKGMKKGGYLRVVKEL